MIQNGQRRDDLLSLDLLGIPKPVLSRVEVCQVFKPLFFIIFA